MAKFVIKSVLRCVVTITAMSFAVGCDDSPGYQYPTPPIPEPLPDGYVWSELPQIPEVMPANNVRITHYETFNKKYGRSFSIMYDTKEKVSYWVAYPLHSIYMGGGRTGLFAYDPKVLSSLQMPVTQSEGGYGVWGYDRGHQLPSADRTSTQAANQQTFYITNMTPQNSTLNQGQWAGLEGWVRDRANESGIGRKRYDTLYVVTGCTIPANPTDSDYITKKGVKGVKPAGYYKVLLRTKSGRAKVPYADDAECIGFWMENKAPSTSWKKHVKKVSEIEQITGHNFFPMISPSVKESYNKSQWNL